jgi:hypothetical protein
MKTTESVLPAAISLGVREVIFVPAPVWPKKGLRVLGIARTAPHNNNYHRHSGRGNPGARSPSRLREHCFNSVSTDPAAGYRSTIARSFTSGRNLSIKIGDPCGANVAVSWRIKIELERRSRCAELNHVARRQASWAGYPARIYECSVTTIQVGDFNFRGLGGFDVNASVLTTYQIVTVGVIPDFGRRIAADRELTKVAEGEFLHLVFAAGVGVPHDDPGIQWVPPQCSPTQFSE